MPVQALVWMLLLAVARVPLNSAASSTVPAAHAIATTPQAANKDPVLDRATDYVEKFEKTFSAVTWRERYEQEDRRQRRFGSSGSRVMQLMGKRLLESQLLFVWLPREASWIAVRDVIAVDGKEQGDANRTLQKLSAGGGSISVAQLKTLAAENGRFNIGSIVRTFNEPTLVLLFLDERYRQRFEFQPRGEETRKTGRARIYRFIEHGRPTVIQSNSRDLPSQGLLAIEPDTGRILFTALFLMDGANVNGNLEVEYGAHADFDVLVPMQMKEAYYSINGEEVKAIATYSDFRRFEAHSRIIVP